MPQTPDELCARIQGMLPGGVELLTRERIDYIFAGSTLEQQKLEVVSLGEKCGCGVMFVGTDNIFVRFTRKQDLDRTRRQ